MDTVVVLDVSHSKILDSVGLELTDLGRVGLGWIDQYLDRVGSGAVGSDKAGLG